MNLGLSYATPNLEPSARKDYSSGRLVSSLNVYFLVPTFSAPQPNWLGASYIVAKFDITTPSEFALLLPITAPSNTFIACIKYIDSDTGECIRYRLWGELTIAELYAGESIEANEAELEIWSVQGASVATLSSDWKLYLTELYNPTLSNETAGTEYPLSAPCVTHSGSAPVTLDDFLSKCS